MSITFVNGKPGGGKGLYAMKLVIDEIRHGKRPIITNLAIRLGPWVSADGKPQAGLLAYLERKYGDTFDAARRIFMLDDEQCKEFYRWRVDKVRGVLVECPATEINEKTGKCVAYDTSLAVEHGGVMYVIDEGWKFFSARDWASTGQGALFYSAQHRKVGDDFLMVTQNSRQIDSGMRTLAQDFHVIRNHSKERVGIFKQPGVFSVMVYGEAPTPASTAQTTTVFRLDAAGIGGSYDTSAGVGIVGRASADTGERKKGFHWAWIFVCFGLFVGLAILVPKLIGHGVAAVLIKGDPAKDKAGPVVVPGAGTVVPGAAVPVAPVPTNAIPRPVRSVPADPQIRMEQPPLPDAGETLTGLVKIGGKVWIMTSKHSYPPGHPAIELVTQEFVVIRGSVYRWPETVMPAASVAQSARPWGNP